MRGGTALLAAWAFALAAAAAVAEPAPRGLPNPILDPAQRWAFDGFSMRPPQERDWYSLSLSRTRMVLARRGPSGEEGAFATVVAERIDTPLPTPEAFLAAMRARRARDIDATRVTAVRHEETLESAQPPWCTRYHVQANEVVPWYAAARVTEVLGRACLHPEVAGLVMDAAYAVRAPFMGETGDGQRLAADFLASLRILPAPTTATDPAELLAAARAGDPTAAYRLGAAYERGRGVEPDPAEAERWYREAAREGEVDALYNLGALLERGTGRPRELRAAAEFFRRASDQRDAQAQLNLGLLYYKGDGVPRDYALAAAFLQLAALNGNARAKELVARLKFAD
jgi:hypothetical protein